MSRMVFVASIVIVLVSVSVAQDINGKWIGQMQGPDGPMGLNFTFKVSADTLTGGVESPMGEIPISNGKINGETFTFDVNLGEMVIHHNCTFLKDSISVKFPGMEGDTVEMFLKCPPASK